MNGQVVVVTGASAGFHESLRCELLHDGSHVRVTMVQMPAVNTPQFGWVRSRLPQTAPSSAGRPPPTSRSSGRGCATGWSRSACPGTAEPGTIPARAVRDGRPGLFRMVELRILG